MNKIKKKELLVHVEEPQFFRHAANEKHRETTVCVMTFAIPVAILTNGYVSKDMVKAVEKVAKGFPEANLHFNYKPQAPAFIFSVKGKTECRGTDTYDQRIGDAVAEAKALFKAYTIASRVVAGIKKEVRNTLARLNDVSDFIASSQYREHNYLESEHYMRILQRDNSSNIGQN